VRKLQPQYRILFRWCAARIGIISGLVLAITYVPWATNTRFGFIRDAALTLALVAFVMAAVPVLTTMVFVSRWQRTRLTEMLHAVSSLLLTMATGIALLVAAFLYPYGSWVRMPDPPFRAESFAGPTCRSLSAAESHVAVVYAPQNGYAVFQTSDSTAFWTVHSAVPSSIIGAADGCNPLSDRGTAPWFRGTVAATLRIDDVGADCGGRSHYILSQDGSIWMWSTGGCAILILVMGVVYLLLVLFLGSAAAGRAGLVPWPAKPEMAQDE